MATREVTDKAFNESLKILCKSFGAGYNHGIIEENYKTISTGYPELDEKLTLGGQGLYLGGIIELFGSESSGKTALALRICGNAQKLGMKCCWIDAEASFDPTFAKINGCDFSKLVVPDLAETNAIGGSDDSLGFFNVNEVLEMIYQTVVQNVFSIVVVDSVAGLMPESTISETSDPNKAGIGEVARAMSRMLPKIAAACKKTETSVIFINQLRDKPGEFYVDRLHTPGGRSLKFFSVLRISIEKNLSNESKIFHTNENGQNELMGHTARIAIIKNKKNSPTSEKIEIPIYYKEYFPDDAQNSFDYARRLKVISVRNGIFTWKNRKDDSIIVQAEGEMAMIEKIRSEKLVGKLVADCLIAQDDVKNKEAKVSVKVPNSLAKLAEIQEPQKTEEIQIEEPKKKKKDKLNIL